MHSNTGLEKVDSKVFADIYNQYYSRIYNYIRYRVKDPHLSEDLVSQVFERMIKGYGTYNPQKGKFSTWLFTIANNTVKNHYNRGEVKNTSPWDEMETLESKYSLEDIIVIEELKEMLLAAVSCLDERQRNIIAFKFAGRLTNRQIAELLEISESNVGTILYRALSKLNQMLTERGAGDR